MRLTQSVVLPLSSLRRSFLSVICFLPESDEGCIEIECFSQFGKPCDAIGCAGVERSLGFPELLQEWVMAA